jgi:hypothetical protein
MPQQEQQKRQKKRSDGNPFGDAWIHPLPLIRRNSNPSSLLDKKRIPK